MHQSCYYWICCCSSPGIVQTGGNLISSPISVMTSLPAGFPTDLNSITTTTSTTPPSTTTASTPTSSPTQGNIISTPAGLLTGPINIINAAHGGLLSTGAVSLSGGAQLAAATGITSARLSQLALKGHGGIRAQGPLSLLPVWTFLLVDLLSFICRAYDSLLKSTVLTNYWLVD